MKTGRPKGLPEKNEHGETLNKDGSFMQSSGTGEIRTMRIIPPADMADMVKKGLAPYEIPNWDRDDPDSNWNLRYRKLTPERKAIFLSKLEQIGVQKVACRFAGVTPNTIREHRKQDVEFDEACTEAEDYYHACVAASILHQARVGQIDERWDKEGNLLSKRVSFETQIRIKMLDKADPSYMSVSKQEVAVVGGAVVVPAPADSVESWDAIVARHTGSPASPASLPEAPLEPGKALSEGRVVKRAPKETIDVQGVDSTDGVDSEEPATE